MSKFIRQQYDTDIPAELVRLVDARESTLKQICYDFHTNKRRLYRHMIEHYGEEQWKIILAEYSSRSGCQPGTHLRIYNTRTLKAITTILNTRTSTLKGIMITFHTHKTTLYRNMSNYYGKKEWAYIVADYRDRRGIQKGERRSIATEFKKGTLTGANKKRIKLVGTTSLRKLYWGQGKHQFKYRVFIKINDIPYANYGKNWVLYARYLWIRKHGNIPNGKCVVFLDMDSTNFENDNLACMTLTKYRAYLDSRFPEKKAKRVKKITLALRRSWRRRRIKETSTNVHVWDCPACGYTCKAAFDKCPKCAGRTCEEIKIAV